MSKLLRLTVVFLVFLMLAFAALWLAKPVISSKISHLLQGDFPGATISYENWKLSFPPRLSIRNLKINDKSYSIFIPDTVIELNSRLLTNHQVESVIFESPEISVHPAKDFKMPVSTGAGGGDKKAFSLRRLEIRRLRLNYDSPGLTAQALISLSLDAENYLIKNASVEIAGLKGPDFELKNMRALLPPGAAGSLTAESVRYQKVKCADLKARLEIKNEMLFISDLTGAFTGGTLNGAMQASLKDDFPFEGRVSVASVSLPSLLKDLELDKKISVTGVLLGRIQFKGRLRSIDSVEGDLSVGSDGGNLVITDQTFLDNLAKNTKQPLSIIEASFKEYHFDTGALTLSKSDKNLGLAVHLNGQKGKRDLDVQLHDIF